jgi:AraC-like DNA-binding protein
MAGVRYREIAPSAAVQSFVESFWALDDDGAGPGPPQRVVPDGHSELILNLESRSSIFRTAAGIASRVPSSPGRFKVHAAAFSRPRANSGRPFHARGSADAAIAIAAGRMVRSRGALSLAGLAGDLSLSNRQFERRFQAAVGLSPKPFCGLQRFTQVFRVIGAGDSRWVETALACGYYDQAHLIRDFKRDPAAGIKRGDAENAEISRSKARKPDARECGESGDIEGRRAAALVDRFRIGFEFIARRPPQSLEVR